MPLLNGLLLFSGISGGASETSITVIIEGAEIVQTLEAEVISNILEAEIVPTILEAEIPEPLEAEIN